MNPIEITNFNTLFSQNDTKPPSFHQSKSSNKLK